MPQFICPVCGEKLTEEEKRYFCPKGHSFDRAAGGYVNLLISRQSGAQHGDDRVMVRARRDFLDGGYYEPLREAICRRVYELCRGKEADILDAGCGECWYTSGLEEYLSSRGVKADIAGIDISKDALRLGSKRGKKLHLAVASAFRLPVEDEKCDIILNVFAPFAGEEYKRVLKKGGLLIHVSPDERHLWELKSAVYDKPYLNDAAPPGQQGLEETDCEKLKYSFDIAKKQDIKSLFMMTPYAHKTSPGDIARLEELDFLHVTAEFIIRIYKKL